MAGGIIYNSSKYYDILSLCNRGKSKRRDEVELLS